MRSKETYYNHLLSIVGKDLEDATPKSQGDNGKVVKPDEINREEKEEENKIVDDDYEPLPLIKTGTSMAADMRFGWKPQTQEVSGAPIPLHYDFETIELPRDPLTGKRYDILFLG